MQTLSRIYLTVICIIAGLHISILPALCQVRIDNADILRAPERYYNQQVKLLGKVSNIQAEGNSMNGTYQLQDKSGTEITILSDILPLIGKSYEVTVVVYQGQDAKTPLIREISRSEKQRKYIGYILGGALIMAAVMIVMGGSSKDGIATVQ